MSAGTFVTDGPLLLAMPVAALAGLVSFASPCVLPLVPGYLSYVAGLSGSELAEREQEQPQLVDVADGDTLVRVEAPIAPRRIRSRVVVGSLLFVFRLHRRVCLVRRRFRAHSGRRCAATSGASSRCSASSRS